MSACNKSDKLTPLLPSSSLTFSANGSLISFPVNLALNEEVYDTHTTLITGEYEDTSSRRGSISIRCFGDTTGRYQGDSLLVTYVSSSGKEYYNTKDSGNVVMIDRYVKRYNGAESIHLDQGIFTALYQE
jgi:hypothetical protein